MSKIEEFLDYYVQPYFHVGAKERFQTLRREWEREAYEKGVKEFATYLNKDKRGAEIGITILQVETFLQQDKDKDGN